MPNPVVTWRIGMAITAKTRDNARIDQGLGINIYIS